jgi:SAM-dependent methyltransferase
MTIWQWLTEHNISAPLAYSRKKCLKEWSEKTNESVDVGNRPIDYAEKETGVINYLSALVSKYAAPDDKILEIGCNAGSNLNGLYQKGYRNLNGVKINNNALEQMKVSFPNLYQNTELFYGDAAQVIRKFKPKSIDLIFTMAVLIHIHPSVSNALFDEMVRVSKGYIITIEHETNQCNYVFPRNYRRVFESRGCRHLFEDVLHIKDYEGYTVRVFET